ncbi:3445_t:CDS:2, partial [Gigaspora margarita]
MEFSWIHWLFNTVDDSADESIVEVCGLQNASTYLDVLEDDFDWLITYEALRITNTDGLLEIEINNKDEDSGS